MFPFGRAVRSSRKKKKGVLFLFQDIMFFSGCTKSDLFSIPNQQKVMRQITFHLVRSEALWGGVIKTNSAGTLLRNEAVRGHSFRSCRKKNVFGSIHNPGPRQPNQYERYPLHRPRYTGVDVHLRWCPFTSRDAICSRAVGPFGRAVRSPQTRKKGATLIFPPPTSRCTVFLGLH